MFTRRKVLTTVPAAVAAASLTQPAGASAEVDVQIDPAHMTDAQKKLHAIRFPKLDQEGVADFVLGFKKSLGAGPARQQWVAHTQAFLRSKGLDMLDDSDLAYEQAWATMMQDPLYAARTRVQWSAQDIMWDRVMRVFHRDADTFLAKMDAADKTGPGTLELNPDLVIPEYALHEIHRQPGGYVGDAFAGWVYHWALAKIFYQGRSDHDEMHEALAQSHPKPADGQVRRVLDVGCSSGMTTTSYKERFPHAEVWGIDAGAPMVRYAHYRAAKMNLEVHFAQRLAEDTKFPDNHFCMVDDFFLFHEVPVDVAKKIAAEMFRITRPGGVWKHNDIASQGNPNAHPSHTILGKAGSWDTHRNNYEPWWIDRENSDFPAILRAAGFQVDITGEAHPNGVLVPRVISTKPV
jgi:SAM-dependent methyltransferase